MNTPPRVEASLTTRARVWFHSLPLITKSGFVLCTCLGAFTLLTAVEFTQSVCLNAYLVVQQLQIYRIFTSAIVHNGVLHLAFNMLAFVPIAAALERHFGSIQLAYLMLLFLLLGDTFHIACTYAAELLLQTGHTASCAVGLSGVIFALIVVDTHTSNAQQRSIFGFFNVPAPYFPWALLILWQLLLPHVSFFGHLGGLLAGQLYAWGWLQRLVPSPSSFQAVERQFPFRFAVPLESFICNTGNGGGTGSVLPTSYAASHSGQAQQGAPPHSQGRSSRMGGLPGWLRLPSSEPPSESSPASVPGHQASGSGDGKFEGRGHVLGGTGAEAPPTKPAWPAPKQAAAAAAEARAQRASASLPTLVPSALASEQQEAPAADTHAPGTKKEQSGK